MKNKDNIYRIIRNCLGLSVKEMSEICGLSAVYYSELERGIKTNPSIETINKIANACGITVNTLSTLMKADTELIRKHLIQSLEIMIQSR